MWLARRKDSNNGLVSVIVALATKGMVTVDKYNSFIAKIHEYASRKQDDHDALDCVAMVMANDMLTTQDINGVIDGSLEIDSLLFEKSEELRQERMTELRKHEDDMSRSQQKLSRVEREKEEALENNRNLQRQIKEKESEAELEKRERIKDRRENELKTVQRNIKDINRLSMRLDEIDRVNGIKAALVIILCYLLLLVVVPLIIWKLDLWLYVEYIIIKLPSDSEKWDVFLSILPWLINGIWMLFVVLIPSFFSIFKGRGFNINPQFMWQIIKSDLSYRKVQSEVAGYEWFYERVGQEPGLREHYYEKDDGIANIKTYIKETRLKLIDIERELERSCSCVCS